MSAPRSHRPTLQPIQRQFQAEAGGVGRLDVAVLDSGGAGQDGLIVGLAESASVTLVGAEWRAASVRGILRFWFRALAGSEMGGNSVQVLVGRQRTVETQLDHRDVGGGIHRLNHAP